MLLFMLFCCMCTLWATVSPISYGNSRPSEPSSHDYPFHANLLQHNEYTNTWVTVCSGSLIHPKWILTTAHCAQMQRSRPRELQVALGSVYTYGNRQIHHVQKIITHPNYAVVDNSGTGLNDIALLELRESAKLNDCVQPIRLHIDDREPLLQKTAHITGFGTTSSRGPLPSRMRKGTMHIADFNKCANRPDVHNTICAVSTLAEGKACNGDSGDPLFIVRNSKPLLVGFLIYITRCDRCEDENNNSVFTRVSSYVPWMSTVTGVNFKQYNQV